MGLRRDRASSSPPPSHERARAQRSLLDALHAGIDDSRILDAFARVPRHVFVPESESGNAYSDVALPIGFKQTISQPSMLALMLAALELTPGARVLEVGGGSGYAAALMAELGAEVFTLEILPELAERAAKSLKGLGYEGVHVVNRNGRLGLPEHAPYDAILVSAAASEIPEELVRELADRGRIAIPVGGADEQRLLVGHKHEGNVIWQNSVPCLFVPLVRGADSGQTDA